MFQYRTGEPGAGGQGAIVPAGKYDVVCVNAEAKRSKDSGNQMIELTWKVMFQDGTEGPKIYDYLVFTPNAFWKIDNCLAACGAHPGEGKDVNLSPEHFIGQKCRIDVIVGKTNKGNERNEIKDYVLPSEF